MALVKAECTNCGAALEVDNEKDAAICPMCNTPYIVEKAINQYVTNNFYGSNGEKKIVYDNIRNLAYQYIDEKEWDKAKEKFAEILKKHQGKDLIDNYYMIQALTHDFSIEYVEKMVNNEVQKYDEQVMRVTGKTTHDYKLIIFQGKLDEIISYRDYIPCSNQNESYLNKIDSFCELLKKYVEQEEKAIKNIKDKKNKKVFIRAIVLILLGFVLVIGSVIEILNGKEPSVFLVVGMCILGVYAWMGVKKVFHKIREVM